MQGNYCVQVCWCKQPTSNSLQTCLYYIYLLKLHDKSIFILLANDLTNICCEISKIWFYEWFILARWKGWRKLKSWVEINVLCIIDQDHQWWLIAVDHASKFKVIYLIVNPPLMVYNTENGASLQKLPDKLQISGKRKWILLLEIEKKENKTLNTFQKLLR